MATIRELEDRIEALQQHVAHQPKSGHLYAVGPKVPPQPDKPRRRSVLFRRRQQLKPLACLTGLEAAGFAAHGTGLGAAATVAGLAAGSAWWYLRGLRRIDRTIERRYTLGCWLSASGWLGVAGATGATHHDTLLWTFGPLLAVPWWIHHRLRPRPRQTVHQPTPLGTLDEIRAAWAARVAGPGGPAQGSLLFELEEIDGGWQAVIEGDDCSSDSLIAQIRTIGARLKLRPDEISIEPSPRGLHQAIIRVQPNNPLAVTKFWTRPTLNVRTGTSVIGAYGDAQPVIYRHWRPGSGPIHSLIAGATRSGKSTLVLMLLGEERHSGVVVSYLIDPQSGQAYSESGFKRAVHDSAFSVDEARSLLLKLRRRMYARNKLMSSIEWFDEKGRRREGIADFTPMDVRHNLPLISVTIDEAQVILADPVCCNLVVEMIALSSKCGIKFRLLVHVPLQGSLGDSQEIKDAVASGNVIVFRTGNPLSGSAAFNGYMPFDPCELPKEWPDGSSTAGLGYIFGPGADRPTTWRSLLIDDPYYWATAGDPAIEDDVIEPEPEPESTEADPDAGRTLTVLKGGAEEEDGLLAADNVLGWFGAQDDREIPAGEVLTYFETYYGMAERTARKALTDLTEAEHLARVRKGIYVITNAGRAELHSRIA